MSNPWEKKIHRASKIREDGGVSALCYVQPRKIDLGRASWTLGDERVTCPDCLKIIEARNARERNEAGNL